MSAPPQPLSGVTVVDLSRLLPGPLASKILADLGARVIKVEEPRMGDPVRLAPPRVDGVSALATILLSGVESIALDLKKPAGRKVLRHLLEEADVMLDTLRPGGLRRLGLDPEELRREHPRLIVCSLTGWGEDGPQAARAGHDLTYQALAGSLAPTEGGDTAPAVPLADVAGAWATASAILAALYERERTGRGRRLDASLYDAAVHANLTAWAEEAEDAHEVGQPLPLTGAYPCYRIYRTKDGGRFALAALEPKFWQRFVRAVDRPDLEPLHVSDDPRAHEALEDLLAERTRDEWRELCEREDLPGEPVLSAAEARMHPQMQARRVVVEHHGMLELDFPARFDGRRPASGRRVPELGQDTDRLLAEVGLTREDLPRARRRAGVGRRFSLKRLLARWLVD